jgi:hypothetical protein
LAQAVKTQEGGLPAVYDFGEDAGAGLENLSANEILTPFLALLQPLSPQLDKTHQKYLPNAEQGMFLNTLTNELYDGETGLECIFIARDYVYGEWVPRDQGGGFKGTRDPSDALVQKLLQEQGGFKKLETPDGTDLVEQYNLYSFVAPKLDPMTIDQVVIGFTSTKIKPYKNLMSRIARIRYPVGNKMVQPPLWAHKWKLTAVAQSNSKGRYWNYHFQLANGESSPDSLLQLDDPLYVQAKGFNEMFKTGKVRADYASTDAGVDDDPPF